MGPESHRARGAPGERGERPWPPRTVPGGQQRRSCPAGGGFPVRAQRPDGKGHCLGQVCSLFTRRPRVPGQRPELDPHGPQATARGLSAFPKPPLRVSPCASCSEALPFTSSCCSEVQGQPSLEQFLGLFILLDRKKKKIKKNPALSWLNNEEQKAPQLSGTKGHSRHCRAL